MDEDRLNSGDPSVPGNLPEAIENDAELLRRFLTARDVPCPRCQYNLRDLTGDRCPECGDMLVLRINIAEPRLAAAITGLMGLSAGAGLNLLLLLYWLFLKLLRDTGGNPPDPFLTCMFGGLLVEGTALALWIGNWKSIQKLTSPAQWGWAFAAWALTLVDLVIFTLCVR